MFLKLTKNKLYKKYIIEAIFQLVFDWQLTNLKKKSRNKKAANITKKYSVKNKT